MTAELPGNLANRFGGNAPNTEQLGDEARRRLDSLKLLTGTNKKTLTAIALFRLVDLDPREHLDEDLDEGIEELLEHGYTEIAQRGDGDKEGA